MSDALADVEFSVNFVQQDDFKDSYFRNNRACGQKNIRCFPTCSDEHVEKHFCGKPLRVVVDMLIRRPNKEYRGIDDIRLIAEFKVLESGYGIASSVKGSILKSKIKSKYTPTNPFFLGKVVESETPSQLPCGGMLHRCVVDFNAECKGWHYAWVGSRFKTCVSHVIAVTVLSIDRKASNSIKAAALHLGDEDASSSSSSSTSVIADHKASGDAGGDATGPSRARSEIDAIMFKPVAHFDSPPFQVASLRRKSDRTDYLLGSAAATQRHQQMLLQQQQQRAQSLPAPSPYVPPQNGFSSAYPQSYNMGLVGMGGGGGMFGGVSEPLCHSNGRLSDYPGHADSVHSPSSSSAGPFGSQSGPTSVMSVGGGSQGTVSGASSKAVQQSSFSVLQNPGVSGTAPSASPVQQQQAADMKPLMLLLSSPSAAQNSVMRPNSAAETAGQPSSSSASSSALYQQQLQQYYSDMMSQQTQPQDGAPVLGVSHLSPHNPVTPASLWPTLGLSGPHPAMARLSAGAAVMGTTAHTGRTILGLPEEVFADIADTCSAAIGSHGADTPTSLADFPADSVVERAIEVIDRALSQDTARSTKSLIGATAGVAEPVTGDTPSHSAPSTEDESHSAGSKRKRTEDRGEPTGADSWLECDTERSEVDADTVAQVAAALHDPTGSIALLAMVADYFCSGAYEAALAAQQYASDQAPYPAPLGLSSSLASYPQSASFAAPSPYFNPSVLLQPYAPSPAESLAHSYATATQYGLYGTPLQSFNGVHGFGALPTYSGYATGSSGVDLPSTSKRPQKCPRCGELKKGHQCSAAMHPLPPLSHPTAAFPQFVDSFVMPAPEDVTLPPTTSSLRSVL